MISYTTGWAQRNVKTHDEWAKWVASLKKGDRCLFQEFIPRGNSCLDSQYEFWRFYEAKFQGDLVAYDNDTQPIKDGYATYWNSDTRWGRVFDARIVPWHSDVAPKEGNPYRDCHAPVFDDVWSEPYTYRHFLIVEPRNIISASRVIKDSYPKSYYRDVEHGKLFTVFASWESEESLSNVEGVRYLYSESLNN